MNSPASPVRMLAAAMLAATVASAWYIHPVQVSGFHVASDVPAAICSGNDASAR